MRLPNRDMTRRKFVRRTVQSAGLLAAGGVGLSASEQKEGNPFAYPIERFQTTDPQLVRYEEVARFACPATEPRRIAIGPDSRVYIAAGGGVSVLDEKGEKITQIGLSAPGRCVCVAPDGTLYAGTRQRIESFDQKGQRLAAWDVPGKKTWLTGLAVGQQEVFAADAGNRVILRYDRAGKPLGRIAEKNRERNIPGLILPSAYLDVKLGGDELLRVNNIGRHRVEVYTPVGELELSWGKPSTAIDGFCGCCNPVGLALLPDGRVVTCEKGLPRVKVYASNGAFESVVAGPESFPENLRKCSMADCTQGGLDAATDNQGRIYVLDLAANNVRVMKRRDA